MKLIDYLQELWTDGRKKKVCMIAMISHHLASSHVSVFSNAVSLDIWKTTISMYLLISGNKI